MKLLKGRNGLTYIRVVGSNGLCYVRSYTRSGTTIACDFTFKNRCMDAAKKQGLLADLCTVKAQHISTVYTPEKIKAIYEGRDRK